MFGKRPAGALASLTLSLVLTACGDSKNTVEAVNEEQPGTTNANGEFEWPEPPDQVATISGHWNVADAGDLYFSTVKERDEIGFEKYAGTYVPATGDPVPFHWDLVQNQFVAMQLGIDYWHEAMVQITADGDLPFPNDVTPNFRFRVGEYQQGTLWYYKALNSLDEIEIAVKRVDDKQSP